MRKCLYTSFLLVVFAACTENASEPLNDEASIVSALEQENGGLDMEDEAPAFGDETQFENVPEDTADAPPEGDVEDACEHGRLRGRWHKVRENGGRLLGGVVNAEGVPIGHIRGIWGQRRNGDAVFFGKYIDRDGVFRGLFRGTYGDGTFRGRWVTRDGNHGVLGGEYREGTTAEERPSGFFRGRWAEAACNLPADPGPPVDEESTSDSR